MLLTFKLYCLTTVQIWIDWKHCRTEYFFKFYWCILLVQILKEHKKSPRATFYNLNFFFFTVKHLHRVRTSPKLFTARKIIVKPVLLLLAWTKWKLDDDIIHTSTTSTHSKEKILRWTSNQHLLEIICIYFCLWIQIWDFSKQFVKGRINL